MCQHVQVVWILFFVWHWSKLGLNSVIKFDINMDILQNSKVMSVIWYCSIPMLCEFRFGKIINPMGLGWDPNMGQNSSLSRGLWPNHIKISIFDLNIATGIMDAFTWFNRRDSSMTWFSYILAANMLTDIIEATNFRFRYKKKKKKKVEWQL